ncbi:anthranilate phosphoribosyltransferase [Gallibacterium genomosp. 2]|uniref:Anthranilate phosphoribosyltransferase n=2 Tax=Gallibacterium TaxID=155493 RepID=A0A0A2XWJ2_9PAST|nr:MULTISPECIES: anthranilate phosphoribosyltransferase [Gallibacterium]KGQ34800.1 anthranilate phosphoribosyltransferase [Gallibacterium genomosp. 2]MDK9431374.1 anthranilate phosphoribosyltransferase [Gallibacterium anatis]WIM80489.1 anthranilate phosphoribosyltransferase [Gallibacterium anatis]
METQQILEQLFNGTSLSREQSKQLFTAVVQGELSNEQLAGALIALKLKGETVDEISGAVTALQAAAEPFPTPDYVFADIVGTGGDGANTINLSTASAIIAASMGAKVAKHGNRSVSSKTGSSDVLAALGARLDLDATTARKALDEIGICFLFAPQYHRGFKHAVPVRQALKTRTIFNILGPLINPAKPKHQLLGVYDEKLLQPYAETALTLGHQHSIVVHGAGLDEVALHAETQVAEIYQGKIERYTLTAEDFGLKPQPLDAIRGGEPEQNAQYIRALLQGKGEPAHVNAVAANTALLLRLFGYQDLKQTTQQVLEQIASGNAYKTLEKLSQY